MLAFTLSFLLQPDFLISQLGSDSYKCRELVHNYLDRVLMAAPIEKGYTRSSRFGYTSYNPYWVAKSPYYEAIKKGMNSSCLEIRLRCRILFWIHKERYEKGLW